jgi:hypothetical protein
MRTIILIIALVLNALATPFILKVKTNNAGTSTSTQFALTPINNGYSYNYHVDWGDDSDNDYTNATAHTHTYAEAGTYSISITENVAGGFAGMQVLGDSLKAVEIVQWGTNAWYEFSHSFSGARNLILSATDTATANFTNVQSFDGAFSTCCLFTGFSYIATPAATTYYSMFSGDTLLVSCGLRGSLTLTNVGRMLKNCKKLKSYASIETRNVTSFIYMFENAAVLDSVKWMRTGNGTDFSGMCLGCGIVSFPVLDISKGRYFISTWAFDSLMVTFPGLNFAAALDLSYTWRCCYLLDSLPDIVTPVLTNCHETIVECRKLRHAPMMNTGLVTNI